MKTTLTLTLLLAAGLPKLALSQTSTPLTPATYVTEIVTDYNGYWRSGNGVAPNAGISPVKPDNSHMLLAFVVNGGTVTAGGNQITLANKYFSTGVNDAILTSKGLPFTASKYQALPVGTLSTAITSNTKVGFGQLYDGVANAAAATPPASGYAQYLTDGDRGLNIGTGVANLPSGTLTFDIGKLLVDAIDDGIPDILVTQIASPSASVDSYQFLDANGAQIAGTKSLSANFMDAKLVVGRWTADFYEAADNPMTLSDNYTNTDRDLRMLAVDLAAFGITKSNYESVKAFQITLSGSSDQAFIAYNTDVVTTLVPQAPLPVQLTAFTGAALGSGVQLNWHTASELNSAYFEAEASLDGQNFALVGRVAAAGATQQPSHYQLDCQPLRPGLGYYRLRQVDRDGAFYYSPTVTVRTGAAAVEVFPSVFTTQLTVHLPAAGPTTLALLAADGRVVCQRQLLAGAATQEVAFAEAASLPAGLYLLRATVDGQSSLHRVVKQ